MSDRSPLLYQADAPIVVVAEGDDERRIIHELLIRRDPMLDVAALPKYKARTAAPRVQILVSGDRNFKRLAGLNPLLPRFESIERLIIVFDAEQDPGGTFDAIRENLGGSGFPLPERAWTEVTEAGRTCVIAVLPDGESTGSLEAMLLEGVTSAPNGTDALQCIDEFIRCMGMHGDRLAARRDKRRLYSWLSVQEEPTRFAGEAAAAGVLPLHTPQLQRLGDLILGVAP